MNSSVLHGGRTVVRDLVRRVKLIGEAKILYINEISFVILSGIFSKNKIEIRTNKLES